ncbi:uncharacterized protein ASPGLDRAFT_24639 [Aspergillus glaucus CBS 516.65]|uniref:Uncharacterized protein n=1 Tax=Aspergillus glaucus CBS 516.65 TaxID=1160497 RepID=A0A1L9VNW4_ASPGL|nr:hypothetical protein ASPGLDRAFT_24639 [Aspergillus glaucus CBS 516.65]OJJ85623.1 hypothetical protein ASPGLDRAFT_24639 [Aspergillus glaucus CBS 516.65]
MPGVQGSRWPSRCAWLLFDEVQESYWDDSLRLDLFGEIVASKVHFLLPMHSGTDHTAYALTPTRPVYCYRKMKQLSSKNPPTARMLNSKKNLLAGSLTTFRAYSQMMTDITEMHRLCLPENDPFDWSNPVSTDLAYNGKFWQRTLHGYKANYDALWRIPASLKHLSEERSMPTSPKLSISARDILGPSTTLWHPILGNLQPFREFLDVAKKWVPTKRHSNAFGKADG